MLKGLGSFALLLIDLHIPVAVVRRVDLTIDTEGIVAALLGSLLLLDKVYKFPLSVPDGLSLSV